MPEVIGRTKVQRLMTVDRAQVVEVLPRDEYEQAHIAGAINIPLRDLNAGSAERLDRKRPVVVYCNDFT
jgi:rhodanese-related sulfurtransferase